MQLTRLCIAEAHRLGNLCLIKQILVDRKFQELTELLVELPVAILSSCQCLKNPSKHFFTIISLTKSRSAAEPPARPLTLRDAQRQILRIHDVLSKLSKDLFLCYSVCAADAAASVATGCCLDMVICWLLLRADCRSEVPKHRHATSCMLHENAFFGHVDITQCKAVFRNHCFAERFGPQICNVSSFLTLHTRILLGSGFISHPLVCHINVLQSTNPLSVEDVFGGLRINGQHWLHLITPILQQRHNSFRLRRSQCCRIQLCLCTASCNDL